MKKKWRALRPILLSKAIYVVARSIGLSTRLRTYGWEEVKDLQGGRIFAGWHGRSMIPANFFKGMGFWAIISLSNDGEMQSRIFRSFGFRILRGSTGRGGAGALIESIKVLRKGDSMAITPDGPRGPIEVVQPGIMLMAKKSGCALIPVGSSAKRAFYAPTWDNYLVPWLFSRTSFVFGEPIYVPEDASDEEVECIRLQMEEAIKAAQAMAEILLGVVPPPPRRKR